MRLTRNHRSIWSIIRDAIRGKSKPRHKRVKWCFNCARVYVGNYVLENEPGDVEQGGRPWREDRKCGYTVVSGDVIAKRRRSIRVKGVYTAGNVYTLQAFVLYPKTETAILKITNGHRNYTVKLVKRYKRSSKFKLRL